MASKTEEQRQHESDYGRGVEDQKNSDFFQKVLHDIADIVTPDHWKNQSYDKGYHDSEIGKPASGE